MKPICQLTGMAPFYHPAVGPDALCSIAKIDPPPMERPRQPCLTRDTLRCTGQLREVHNGSERRTPAMCRTKKRSELLAFSLHRLYQRGKSELFRLNHIKLLFSLVVKSQSSHSSASFSAHLLGLVDQLLRSLSTSTTGSSTPASP